MMENSISDRLGFLVHERPIAIALAQVRDNYAVRAADYGAREYVNVRSTVPGVRIEMTQADWDTMVEIVAAHRRAAAHNPAVLDAWQQYRMLVALTNRELGGV